MLAVRKVNGLFVEIDFDIANLLPSFFGETLFGADALPDRVGVPASVGPTPTLYEIVANFNFVCVFGELVHSRLGLPSCTIGIPHEVDSCSTARTRQ